MSKVSSLGHVGISVTDMDKMLDFYTRILGLTVTDGGEGRGVFLSAHPETEHHEFLISPQPDRHTNAQQISFKIDSLDDLREMYHSLKDYGIENFRITNHGVAIGCYFRDPENNILEVYCGTGLDARQPYLEEVDLAEPPDAIMAKIRASVEQHGATGYVDEDYLRRQNLGAN